MNEKPKRNMKETKQMGKRMKKTWLWLLVCAMVLTMLPVVSLRVEAADSSEGQLTADMFIFTPPTELIYDGQKKSATVTPKDGVACGTMTVQYNKSDENVWRSDAPSAVGTYTVRIVEANVSYSSAKKVTDSSWTFTIDYGEVTPSMYTITNIKTINGKSWAWNQNNPMIWAADGYGINNSDRIVEGDSWLGINYNAPGNYLVYIKETATGKVYRGMVTLDFAFDNTPPVISGIEDRQMYYNQDVTFTVEDSESGVEKVTYKTNWAENGELLTPDENGNYTVPKGMWYIITAYNNVGDSNSVEVYVDTCEHKFFGSTHQWDKDENGNIVSCTASAKCAQRCQQIITETTTDISSKVTQQQSCTEPEITIYTATFTEKRFGADGNEYGNGAYQEGIETKPAAGHKLLYVPGIAATCTEDGNKEYYMCTICGTRFTDAVGQDKTTLKDVTIPALGHSNGEPVYTWAENASTCTAVIQCNRCNSEVAREVGQATSAITKEPTCTETGTRTYTAAFKDERFATQKKDIDVNALGHTPNEDDGDCTTAVTCVRCDYVFTAAKEHDWSTEWEKDASGHWHTCQNVGCTQVDKKDHTPDRAAATEEDDQVCEDCGYVIAAKLGHLHALHLEAVPAKNATCTENGNQAYYKCTEDEQCFSDRDATVPVNESDMILQAGGHTHGDPVYTWSEDLASCTATQSCKTCQSVLETETVNTTSAVKQEQSCTEPELTTYTATFTNETFTAQTNTEQTKDAAGHTVSDWIVDREATVTAEGSKHKECTVCNATLETAAIEKLPPVVYQVIEGADATHIVREDGAYTLRADGAFAKFVNVELDGTVVDGKYYTAKSGSTIITFAKEYMDGLTVGKHTVKVNFADGAAETTLTTVQNAEQTDDKKAEQNDNQKTEQTVNQKTEQKAETSPATGDNSHAAVCLVLALSSAGVLACLGMRKKQGR